MSTVVFSEGKHDVDFLILIHQLFAGKNYDTFIDQESEDDQDTRVRQHKLDETIEYLYKAEGGRSEVIKKFRSHATDFAEYDLILLVDLDDDGFGDFMDQFHDKLEEHYGDALRLSPEKVDENDHLVFYNCDILVHDSPEDQFDLITFTESLEEFTYIKDREDRTIRRKKIKHYTDNCPDIVEDLGEFIYEDEP